MSGAGEMVTSPSGADLMSPITGPLVQKYCVGKEGVSAEERLLMFNFIRDLTASDYAGDEAIATLHGGGSMAAQKQAVLRSYDVEHAKTLAGVLLAWANECKLGENIRRLVAHPGTDLLVCVPSGCVVASVTSRCYAPFAPPCR